MAVSVHLCSIPFSNGKYFSSISEVSIGKWDTALMNGKSHYRELKKFKRIFLFHRQEINMSNFEDNYFFGLINLPFVDYIFNSQYI
jgi:hypothetical protein